MVAHRYCRLQKRLEAIEFRQRYLDALSDVRGKLRDIAAGHDAIRNSPSMKVLLEHVLALGTDLHTSAFILRLFFIMLSLFQETT